MVTAQQHFTLTKEKGTLLIFENYSSSLALKPTAR